MVNAAHGVSMMSKNESVGEQVSYCLKTVSRQSR